MRFGKIENSINQIFVVRFLCLQQFPNRRMPFHHFRMRRHQVVMLLTFAMSFVSFHGVIVVSHFYFVATNVIGDGFQIGVML